MAWLVGIDEAGYGPNLGPFVMTAVLVRVPEGTRSVDLWRVFAASVRRASDEADGRVVVDDSKRVYPGDGDVRELSRSACYLLGGAFPCSLREWARRHWLNPEGLAAETWTDPEEVWPRLNDLPNPASASALPPDFALGPVWSDVVFAKRFNEAVGAADSKAAVPLGCVASLLAQVRSCVGTDTVSVVVDRLGGRRYYLDYLRAIFPETMVMAREESPTRSSYQAGPWSIDFEVRADAQHFSVAAASLVSKWWREMLMRQFNAFWQRHRPNLRPTAGYPEDAVRFWRDVADLRRALGIQEDHWWRQR